jgi:transcriptional regulator with XRE-family HTH domain
VKTLKQKLRTLPISRQKRISRRAEELIAKELTMRELRKARNITQAELARTLGIKQEQISRIEKRTDLHISTLRRSVEAMGGKLVLTATFPNGAPVRLTGFSELGNER